MCDLGPPLTEAERAAGLRRQMSNPRMAHGPEVVERVRELIEAGATYAQIRNRVPVDKLNQVRSLCYAHGMRTKNPQPGGNRLSLYCHTQTRRLIKEGAGYIGLVEGAGFPNVNAARAFVRRHNLGPVKLLRQRPNEDKQIEAIWLLVRERLSVDKIAARTGRNRNMVSGIIWRYGLRGMTQRPKRFKCIYGKTKETPLSMSSPDLAVQVAAGPGHSPRAPGPVCSYRGVSLAHV